MSGKPLLWNFLHDVASNLNYKNKALDGLGTQKLSPKL